MPTLPLTHADLKRLCAIEDADTSADTDLDALITAQQPVWEYALDPAILTAASTNTGLQATLVLGIAEALAGEWLRRQARAPGSTDDFHVGPLTVTASRTDGLAQIGDRLAALSGAALPRASAATCLAARAKGARRLIPCAAKTPLLAHTSTAGGSPFDLGLDWTALP
jgi:hypothetical protein